MYKDKPAPTYRRATLLSEMCAVPTFAWFKVQLLEPSGPEVPAAPNEGNGVDVFTSISEGIGFKAPDGTVYTTDDLHLYSITAHRENSTPKNAHNQCIDSLIGKELGGALRGSWILVPKIQIGENFFVLDAEPGDFTIGLRELIKAQKSKTSDRSLGTDEFTLIELGAGVITVANVRGSL